MGTKSQPLSTVADCLREELRQSDQIARYGGDEFGIILPETPLKGGLRVAERLKAAVGSVKGVYENKACAFTLSCGVASMLPDQDVSKDEFIKMVDQDLSHAKANGKNQCCAVKK